MHPGKEGSDVSSSNTANSLGSGLCGGKREPGWSTNGEGWRLGASLESSSICDWEVSGFDSESRVGVKMGSVCTENRKNVYLTRECRLYRLHDVLS